MQSKNVLVSNDDNTYAIKKAPVARGFRIEKVKCLINSESNSEDTAEDIAVCDDETCEHNGNNRDQLDQDVERWT